MQRTTDKYFITCFGDVTKTIQPCWKINNQQCVFWKMKNLSFAQRAFWQSFWKHYCQICRYIHTGTSRGNVITATLTLFKMPFQLDRWHHGNITVEMFIGLFTELLLSCHNILTKLLRYTSCKCEFPTTESHKTWCALWYVNEHWRLWHSTLADMQKANSLNVKRSKRYDFLTLLKMSLHVLQI